MRLKLIQPYLVISLLLNMTPYARSYSQVNEQAVVKWTIKHPFSRKAFIENRGQFPGEVLFAAYEEGVKIYFSLSGITYLREEPPQLKPSVKEQLEESGNPQGLLPDSASGLLSHKLAMRWIGSNPGTKLICSEMAPDYYTYASAVEDPNGQQTFIAKAYHKIMYKNLYEGIDVEFVFQPEEKMGIKYSVYVNPGADVSLLKMNYEGALDLLIDSEKKLLVKSRLGLFTEHTPVSYYRNGKGISSEFVLEKNTISFRLDKAYDHSQSIVIDPWVSIPQYSNSNKSYNIEYDNQGNVFVYGGGGVPYQLIKINSSGTVQWTFTTTVFTGGFCYGAFTVDPFSGRSYVGEGYNTSGTGARIIKLDGNGNLLSTFHGSPNMDEIWRMSFSKCLHEIVIGGGNTMNTFQTAIIDTSLSGLNAANILNTNQTYHDIAMLALDDQSHAFVATPASINPNYASSYNNTLIKISLPAMAPRSWAVQDGYSLSEYVNTTYVNDFTSGFNGISASSTCVYTYNGHLLKKYDSNTGVLLSSLTLGSGSTLRWAGLSSDPCNTIYLGYRTDLVCINSSFHRVCSISTHDTIYDVKAGLNNLVYCCGNNFVASYQFNASPCNYLNVQINSTLSDCRNNGSASVIISSGTPPIAYSWSTHPLQTSATASGLAPGTYTVTVKDGSCTPNYRIDTVHITAIPSPSVNCASTNASCGNGNGSALANVSGGTPPYTYSWNTVPPQYSISAMNLPAGSYNLFVTDANTCKTQTTVFIGQSKPRVYGFCTITNPVCPNDSGSVILTITGGSAPFNYSWQPSGDTSAALFKVPAGTYSVTVKDSNACSTILKAVIKPASAIVSGMVKDTSICTGASCFISVKPSGGTAPYWVSWIPSGGKQDTMTICPRSDTLYHFKITDASGCKSYDSLWIRVKSCFNTSPLSAMYVPNAFTPNGDGVNDTFGPANTDTAPENFELLIFDRWGNLIWETHEWGKGWDGRVRGNQALAQQDVYAWKITCNGPENKNYKLTGHVSLIR